MLGGFGEAEHRHWATRCVALMPVRCAAEVNEPLRTAACADCLSSVLQEGRENANIDVGLGFIWRIVYRSAQRCRNCACCQRPSLWLPLPRSPRNLPTTSSRHRLVTCTGSMSTR